MSLVRFISRCLIFFETFIKRKISFSAYLLLIFRKATDFFVIWFSSHHFAEIVNCFLKFSHRNLGSLMYNIISCANGVIWLSLFLLYSLIYYFSFIAPAIASSSIVKRGGDRGQSYLFPDFNGIASIYFSI